MECRVQHVDVDIGIDIDLWPRLADNEHTTMRRFLLILTLALPALALWATVAPAADRAVVPAPQAMACCAAISSQCDHMMIGTAGDRAASPQIGSCCCELGSVPWAPTPVRLVSLFALTPTWIRDAPDFAPPCDDTRQIAILARRRQLAPSLACRSLLGVWRT